jgi:hypothetical protein
MDEKYILGLRKGSHADFNKLYDLYADRLYGFAYNLTHSSEMAEETSKISPGFQVAANPIA